jgi:DnaK suppressor protein
MIDRKAIREALLARRQILTRETDLSQVETVELDQSRVGRLSRAAAMQDHQMSLELARRRDAMLEAIARTLVRIDEDPDYGLCDDCGEVIAPARLALDPTQLCCVHCAGKREQGST